MEKAQSNLKMNAHVIYKMYMNVFLLSFQAFYELDELNSKKMSPNMMIKLLKKWAVKRHTHC